MNVLNSSLQPVARDTELCGPQKIFWNTHILNKTSADVGKSVKKKSARYLIN